MPHFLPTPGDVLDISVQLGWVNTNASLTGNVLVLTGGFGTFLAASDPGCVIKIMRAGPGGDPLWTTIATATSTTNGTTTASATTNVSAAQVVIYRPINLFGHLLLGTMEMQSSIRNLPTFAFTLHSPNGSFAPLVGQPILVTHAIMGDIFGGYIEQVQTTNTPGNIPIDTHCECVAWDKKLSKRLLYLASQTIPVTSQTFTLEGQRTYTMNQVPVALTDVHLIGLGSITGGTLSIIWGAEFYQGIGTQMIISGITYAITSFPSATTATLSPAPPNSGGITYTIPQTFNTLGADTTSQWFWDPTTNLLTQGYQSQNVTAETLVPHGGVFFMLSVSYEYSAQLSYTNIGVDTLIGLIMALIADEGFATIVTLATSPPTIASITFSRQDTPLSALQAIISQINDGTHNYWVHVTPRQTVLFEPLGATTAAPWNVSTLDGSSGNIEISISNTVTLEKYINSGAIEIAAAQSSKALSQTIIGGAPPRRSWTLTSPVAATPTITRYTFITSIITGNGKWIGVQQTVGILNDPVTGSDRQWYWSPGSPDITQDAVIGFALGFTSGGAGVPETLVVTYFPQVSLLQSYKNTTEVAARKLIEGGSGQYDGYGNPGSVAALAGSANTNYAQALVSSLDSLAQSLQAVTNLYGMVSGMYLTIHLPELGADGVYVVDTVNLAVRENILTWTIEFVLGAVIGDWKTAWRSWGGGESGLNGLGSPGPGSAGTLLPPTNPLGALTLGFSAGLAQVGVPYNGTLAATGGVPPYVFTVDPLTTLPLGLSLDNSSIIGTPLVSGTFSFTLVVTDFALVTIKRDCTIVVTPATTPIAPGSGITAVAAAVISRSIRLSDQSTHATVRTSITWAAGLSGAQNISAWAFFRRTSGSAAAWYFLGVFQRNVGENLDFDFLVVDGAAVSAMIALQAGISSGDGQISVVAPPANSRISNTFTLVLAAPANNLATVSITNIHGTVPVNPADIYRGVNSLRNPYATVLISLQTPGVSDPDVQFYWFWVEWVNSVGTPIAAGGVSNGFGWQPGVQVPNDGQSHTWNLDINYPAAGIDGYLQIQVWGMNRNFPLGSQFAPFVANTGVVLQAIWAGAATFFRLHVGQPAETGEIAGGNQQTTAVVDASFAWLAKVATDAGWTSGQLPADYFNGNDGVLTWNFAQSLAGGQISVITNDGPSDQNSLRLTGDHATAIQAFTKVAVTPGVPYNLAVWVKSSNTAGAHSLIIDLVWVDDNNVVVGSVQTLTLTGFISAWTQESLGTFAAPTALSAGGLPVSRAFLRFRLLTTEPAGGWWQIDDVMFQSVVNQTGSGQTNTTQPTPQTTDHSAAGASSTTTSATANYGLSRTDIVASDGAKVQLICVAGQFAQVSVTSNFDGIFKNITLQLASIASGGIPCTVSITEGSDSTGLGALGFTALGGSGGSALLSFHPVTGIGMQGGIAYGSLVWSNASPLLHGWSNSGGLDSQAQYSIDPFGSVHLRGAIHNGTITDGTVLFVLPSGYYNPSFRVVVPIVVFNGTTDIFGSLVIDTAGNVGVFGVTSNNNLHLDCVFRVW